MAGGSPFGLRTSACNNDWKRCALAHSPLARRRYRNDNEARNQHFVDLVRTAERAGYMDAWSFESYATEAFAPIAAAAMLAPRMRFGTAIVPVFTRPPGLIAMSAATVQQLSGGRFILGLGTSTPVIVQQWMGVPFERPLTRVRETVAAIRSAF